MNNKFTLKFHKIYLLILVVFLSCSTEVENNFITDNENLLNIIEENELKKQILKFNKENNVLIYVITTPFENSQENFDNFLKNKLINENKSRIIIGVSKNKRKFAIIANDYFEEKVTSINLEPLFPYIKPHLIKFDFFEAIKATIIKINNEIINRKKA